MKTNVLNKPTKFNTINCSESHLNKIKRSCYDQYLYYELEFELSFPKNHASSKICSHEFFTNKENQKQILNHRIQCRKNKTKEKEIKNKAKHENDKRKILIRSSGFYYSKFEYAIISNNERNILQLKLGIKSQLDVSMIDIYKTIVSAMKKISVLGGSFKSDPIINESSRISVKFKSPISIKIASQDEILELAA